MPQLPVFFLVWCQNMRYVCAYHYQALTSRQRLHVDHYAEQAVENQVSYLLKAGLHYDARLDTGFVTV